MDIQSILQDDKKKKVLIIALIVLFLLLLVGGSVYYFSSQSSSQNNKVLTDITFPTPRDGAATSTLKRLPLIALAADHTTVAPGQLSKISWTTSNATNCKNGAGDSIDLSGSLSISPTEPYTFDVLCTGPYGTQSQSITIAVSTAPIIELIAVPPSVLSGKQSYISWNTTNADRCEDSKGGTLRLTGGFSIKPTAPYTFSMSCIGEKGTTKKTITVGIASPFDSNGSGKTGNNITDNANGNTFTDTGIIAADGSGTDGSGTGTTFSADVTATPDHVAFNGNAKIAWKITNLKAPDYCIIESTNQSKSYLPGLLSNINLSSSALTPPLTTDETVTLSCWKDNQKIVKTVKVTVGAKPPTPSPNITTFSVTVVGASTKNYAAAGSQLLAKWSTNAAAKVSACVLKRNGLPVVGVPNTSNAQNITGSQFTEFTAGLNYYTLTCTGEGGTITGIPTSGPAFLAIVNCTFMNGFGDNPEETMNGVVEPGSRYDASKNEVAICTYTYGTPNANPPGDAAAFAKIWDNFAGIGIPGNRGYTRNQTSSGLVPHYGSELRSSRDTTSSRVAPYTVGGVPDEGEKLLCPFTVYTAYKDNTGVLHKGKWMGDGNSGQSWDKGYHKNWGFLDSGDEFIASWGWSFTYESNHNTDNQSSVSTVTRGNKNHNPVFFNSTLTQHGGYVDYSGSLTAISWVKCQVK